MIIHTRLESAHLAGNLLGDRSERDLFVCLPPAKLGSGRWVDSPVTGNFEPYLLHDVVSAVDAAYRAIPTAGSRVVFGLSSGGFGAWNLGSRNPAVALEWLSQVLDRG